MGAVTPVMTLVEVNLVPRDSDGRVIHDAASVEVSKTQHIVITIIIVIITIITIPIINIILIIIIITNIMTIILTVHPFAVSIDTETPLVHLDFLGVQLGET